jgi:anti-sigma factor RsiW
VSRRIECREAVERLWAYLDNDLDDVDKHAVDDHLAFCLRCCGELAFAREVRGMLARGSALRMPPDVQERLEDLADRLTTEDLAEPEINT